VGVKLGLSHWREGHKLRMFENRVLRKIFETQREDLRGEWRKLHREELTKYYSGNKIKKNKIAGACGSAGDSRGT
jgi:hypothetical protein